METLPNLVLSTMSENYTVAGEVVSAQSMYNLKRCLRKHGVEFNPYTLGSELMRMGFSVVTGQNASGQRVTIITL